MAKKQLPAKTKKTTPSKKGKSGRKPKYRPDMIETAVNITFSGGGTAEIQKILGISNATYHTWRGKFPDFEQAISRARVDYRKLKERKFNQEAMSAFAGLNELLTGRIIPLKEEHSSHIYNETTGKITDKKYVKTVVKETYVRADMKAIEKVLGPNDIRHNAYLVAMEEEVLNNNDELYKMVFGKLPIDSRAEEFAGIYALNPHLDLVKLRYMEAYIQGQFDNGNIPLPDYMDYTDRIRKNYIFASAKMEERAQKLLDGRTYQEVIETMIALWKTLLEATEAEIAGKFKTTKDKPYKIPTHIQKELIVRIKNSIDGRQEKELFALQRLPK